MIAPVGEMPVVPSRLEIDGEEWQVARAWPSGAATTLELDRDDAPDVRAGVLHSSGHLELLPPRSDPRLPGLSVAAAGGTVVSHRAGRRAVVRSGDGSRFTKVVRPGRGAELVEALGAGAALTRGLRSPDLIAAGDDHVVLSTLPGRSLLAIASDPAAAPLAWDDWARAWPAATTGGRHPHVRHDASAEHTVLRDWQKKASAALTAPLRARLAAVVEHVGPALEQGPPGPFVLAHRDLHDQQLLWDPGHGPGVLDVDTVCAAESALDLGNLRAHVALRSHQGLYASDVAHHARTAIDAAAAATGAHGIRVEAYERASLARLVCVYAFRPRWRHLVTPLLQSLEAHDA